MTEAWRSSDGDGATPRPDASSGRTGGRGGAAGTSSGTGGASGRGGSAGSAGQSGSDGSGGGSGTGGSAGVGGAGGSGGSAGSVSDAAADVSDSGDSSSTGGTNDASAGSDGGGRGGTSGSIGTSGAGGTSGRGGTAGSDGGVDAGPCGVGYTLRLPNSSQSTGNPVTVSQVLLEFWFKQEPGDYTIISRRGSNDMGWTAAVRSLGGSVGVDAIIHGTLFHRATVSGTFTGWHHYAWTFNGGSSAVWLGRHQARCNDVQVHRFTPRGECVIRVRVYHVLFKQ